MPMADKLRISKGDGFHMAVPRTKPVRYAIAMLGLFLPLCLASCSKPPPDRPVVQQDQSKPAYWPVSSLKGVYLGGVETSAMFLCSVPRGQCVAGFPEDGCWVEFSKRASDQVTRIIKRGDRRLYGEYWFEGAGRVAWQPGNFGHLATYKCQVELIEVRQFDDGPPYAFRPPPP